MAVNNIGREAFVCPLCGQGNACVNLGAQDVAKSCWCNDPSLRFPEALLAQIPAEQRGKACICRACVEAYWQQHAATVISAP